MTIKTESSPAAAGLPLLGTMAMTGALQRLLQPLFEGEGAGTGEGGSEVKPNGSTPPPASRGRTRDDDDDDHGEGDPVTSGDKWREPTAYERTLRKENQKYRKRAREAEEAGQAQVEKLRKEKDAEIAKMKSDSDAALAKLKGEGNARLIRFELKTSLKSANCQDVDAALKLIDASAIKITDAGDVEGIDALIDALKKDKAYLFQSGSSTSKGNDAPPPKEPTKKKVGEMTEAEYQAAKAAMTGVQLRR